MGIFPFLSNLYFCLMPYKIAVAELHHETNSFSKVLTDMRSFEGLGLHYGEDIWTFGEKWKAQVYGFRKAVEKYGKGEFSIVPIYAAWAWSGGPIQRDIYDHFKNLVLDTLRDQPDLDGLYLSLHGAMGVEGLRDPESDLLQAVRDIKGNDFPVGVSYDLHANLTRKNVELATFIVGYHTNPHRDHKRVGYRVGRILMDTIRGKVKPVMAWRKMRLLKGGGMGVDFLPPMLGIIRSMKRMERRKDVLAVSNFWVHIWIDDPELGWSTLVVTDANQTLAEDLAEDLADKNWKVRDRKHPTPKDAEKAIRIAKGARIRRKMGTVVFCDTSDVVGAGAPGENTHLLAAIMEQAPELRSYIPVRSPESAIEAFEAGVGAEVSLTVGKQLEQEYNREVHFEGKVIHAKETAWGKTAVIVNQGIHLILTEMPFPAYFPKDYREVGLNLWKADITIVKNLFPFRFKFLRYNRKTVNVVTNGITNLDVHTLKYEEVPRPIYPLDSIDDWR